MRNLKTVSLAAGACVLLLAGSLIAATEAEKQAAIDAGLKWLASTQQADGHWEYSVETAQDTAATAAAVLAFLEEGYTAGTDVVIGGTNYGDVVGQGLTFIFSQAQLVSIFGQPAGNPDGDGNGYGVKFIPGGINVRDTYVTGLVLPAIASTGTPNAVVTTGPLAGWTYKEVVQNGIDYFAYGQSDSGTARGGWRYYANYGSSDNSTSQWPAVSILFATEMGVSAPTFVEDELRYWVDYIQNDFPGTDARDGGSNYYFKNDASWGSNVSRTGTWLTEAFLTGTDATQVTTADVNAALEYLDSQWKTYANSTWNGNLAHPYAMWAAYKGLETQIGLGDTTAITNLFGLNTWRAGATLDPGDTYNWWEEYCEYLVATLNSSGYWNGYTSYWYGPLAAAWYINILAATEIPGEVIPEPGTLALMGLGAVGLVLLARRRKNRSA